MLQQIDLKKVPARETVTNMFWVKRKAKNG